MGASGSLKRLRYLLLGGVFAGLLGMGFIALGEASDSYSLPPSNRQVAEKVLVSAMENLGIPEGKGKGILFRTEGNRSAGDLLGFVAEGYLLKHGYQVHERGNFPEFRFDLDTLFVRLDIGLKVKKHTVERFAEARISAYFQETENVRKVYTGRGVSEDSFPSRMIGQVGKNDTFVIQHSTLYSAVKPVLFGVIITGLVWLLYSYRG